MSKELKYTLVFDTVKGTMSLKGVEGELAKIDTGLAKTSKGFRSFNETISTVSHGINIFRSFIAGIQQIASSFSGAVQATNEYSLALKGLSEVARAYGQDMGKADKYAKQLATDGLISITDSATTLKYLMSSGFKIDEAFNMAKAMKDIGSFNNVVGDLGQAMRDSAKGIKTGSMELAENIGFTERFSSIMKKAHIDISNGIDLTNNASQRQAYYNMVLKEGTKFQGNSGEYAKTASGQYAQFGNSLSKVNIALGEVVNKISLHFLPGMIKTLSYLDNITAGFQAAAHTVIFLGKTIYSISAIIIKTFAHLGLVMIEPFRMLSDIGITTITNLGEAFQKAVNLDFDGAKESVVKMADVFEQAGKNSGKRMFDANKMYMSIADDWTDLVKKNWTDTLDMFDGKEIKPKIAPPVPVKPDTQEQEKAVKDYYDKVKFEDKNYYDWKLKEIEKEAEKQKLLTKPQREQYKSTLISQLNKERDSYDASLKQKENSTKEHNDRLNELDDQLTVSKISNLQDRARKELEIEKQTALSKAQSTEERFALLEIYNQKELELIAKQAEEKASAETKYSTDPNSKMNAELEALQNDYEQKLISEELFQQAKAEIQKRYADAETENKISQWNNENKLLSETISEFANGFGNVFSDVLANGANFVKSLSKMIENLIANLLSKIVSSGILTMLTMLLNPAAGSFGTVFSKLLGFESGGGIPGEEKLIRVNEKGEEYVINAEKTARFKGILDFINFGSMDKVSSYFKGLSVPNIRIPMLSMPHYAGGGTTNRTYSMSGTESRLNMLIDKFDELTEAIFQQKLQFAIDGDKFGTVMKKIETKTTNDYF